MRKLIVVGVVLMISIIAVFSIAYASSYLPGQIVITCDGWVGMNNVGNAVVFDRANVPGEPDQENYRFEFKDGAGNIIWQNEGKVSHGAYYSNVGEPWQTAPQYNPIYMRLISKEGNGLPEVVFGTEVGYCDDLPTYSAPVVVDGVSICPLPTANAIVGDLPFATQAFYEPGKAAPGVVLNPGTYWVFGVDESGGYYKILLACQYLWVPVDSMQPSFLPPQNGALLPTDVVS